ncbi:hypothetical protein VTO42DRAFT_5623 [Malbranchea cinnamomea]
MTEVPLRYDPSPSDMEYNPYLVTPHTRRFTTTKPNGWGSSHFGAEGETQLMHRRSRTETVPSSSRTGSPSRRTSESSLDDISLGHMEEASVKSKLFGGIFQGDYRSMGRGGLSRIDDDARNSRSPSRSQKRMPMPSPLKQVTSANPFSFFTSRNQDQQRLTLPEPADDEFLNLDIDEALFPSGHPASTAEEAFKNLRENAERLIRQLQAAYKLRTFALHEALAEKQAQKEELEESASRFQNIKAQLNEMAARVVEQDRVMKSLVEDLEIERQRRQEEEDARRRLEILQMKEVEGGIDRERLGSSSRVRHSKHSILSSDSGFESGEESIAESTFSKRNDETVSPSVQSSDNTTATTPTSIMSPPPFPQSSGTPSQKSPVRTQQSSSRPSAYDRVMKGITSSGIGSSFSGLISTSRCSNCRGLSSADAWSVVNVLKEENKALKFRLSELESAVDECITLVGG